MFLEVVNNIKGYVVIEVSGFSVERFMNMAVHKNIFLWDIVRDEGVVTMKVSIKGFKLLKPCARKTKCKIKIRDKSGVPFWLFRYRKRKVLAAGIIFFIGFLYFLSSFIWLVEVEGNSRIQTHQIIEFLNEQGLKEGVFKASVDTKTLEKMFLYYFSDISFIHIDITGTKATVHMAETIEKQQVIDKSIPCNIVAKKDGLIMSVGASSGTPLAKRGDVVREGDILVSSEIIIGTQDEQLRKEYVHAYADVRAKIFYEIEFLVPYEYKIKKYTGEKKVDRYIILLDKTINLRKTSIFYNNYDKIIERTQLGFGESYPLPVIFAAAEYREFIEVPKSRTEEEARSVADRAITNRIVREFSTDTDIIDKKTTFTDLGDGLHVKCLLTTIERIDAEAQVSIPIEGNEENPDLPGTETNEMQE